MQLAGEKRRRCFAVSYGRVEFADLPAAPPLCTQLLHGFPTNWELFRCAASASMCPAYHTPQAGGSREQRQRREGFATRGTTQHQYACLGINSCALALLVQRQVTSAAQRRGLTTQRGSLQVVAGVNPNAERALVGEVRARSLTVCLLPGCRGKPCRPASASACPVWPWSQTQPHPPTPASRRTLAPGTPRQASLAATLVTRCWATTTPNTSSSG
jgi:hypothetical protein